MECMAIHVEHSSWLSIGYQFQHRELDRRRHQMSCWFGNPLPSNVDVVVHAHQLVEDDLRALSRCQEVEGSITAKCNGGL